MSQLKTEDFTSDFANTPLQDWRRFLHRFPEIGFDVHDTANFVAGLLEGFGLDVHTKIGQTGVVGVLKKGKSTNAIGLRADMDALCVNELNTFEHKSQNKGHMHACGHDGLFYFSTKRRTRPGSQSDDR